MTFSQGEVFDLGYQHYDGPREGRMRARKALWINGVRSTIGLGRGARAKILPILLFVAVMLPALIFTLIASQSGTDDGSMVGHAGYYQVVLTVIYIFAAIMAPELLCPDRRDGVLNLYLVRPLTATDYVVGRWLAFLSITLALVYFGQTVLFVGMTLAADEPWNYLRDNWLDVPRFLAAGLVVALFITTLPMAIAAFASRRAYAAAVAIGIALILSNVASALTMPEYESVQYEGSTEITPGENGEFKVFEDIEPFEIVEGDPVTGGAAKWIALVDMGSVTIHINDHIFNRDNDDQKIKLMEELPAVIPILWYIIFTAGPAFLLWRRYQRIVI